MNNMRLHIQHTTRYRYDHAPNHLTQLMRLTPRADAHQRIIEWRIQAPGKQNVFLDAFGNLTQVHVVGQPAAEMNLIVQGIVEMSALAGGRLQDDADTVDGRKNGERGKRDESGKKGGIAPITYRLPTALTAKSDNITKMASQALPQGLHTAEDALVLAAAVCQAMPYTPGKTDVTSTAAESFALGQGVCQDHAHVMIAACQALDVPARYVSGYVDPGNSRIAASHAWVDLWLQTHWVSVDVTNALLASNVHCRLAIGRDYLDACPVRGVREGGMVEALDVSVTVHALQQ